MPDDMTLDDYLAQGGRLTTPMNVPPRYRAELMKLMSVFVDSALAGAAGFADVINDAPGIKQRIAAAKIVLEKNDNADRVLRLMGEFGANTERYANHHPWTDRLPRDTAPGSKRSTHDMRLSVLNYPLAGWVDAVVMNLVMGHAVAVQLADMARVSYQPLAEAVRAIATVETRHTELAAEGLRHLIAQGQIDEIHASLSYWVPRVAAIFGDPPAERAAQLQAWRLRHTSADDMRAAWQLQLADALDALDLTAPA